MRSGSQGIGGAITRNDWGRTRSACRSKEGDTPPQRTQAGMGRLSLNGPLLGGPEQALTLEKVGCTCVLNNIALS